jgi:hypothetical protein
MRRLVGVLAAAAMVCASGAARADSFSFSFVGSGLSGSASVSGAVDSSTPGAFDITSGSLTMDGMLFTLAPDPSEPSTVYSADGEYLYNDVFYTGGGSIVDLDGLLFNNGAGGEVNLFNQNGYVISSYGFAGSNYNTQPVSVNATPELSGIVLLGTGVLGMALLLRRRGLAQ